MGKLSAEMLVDAPRGPKCGIARAFASMDDEDAVTLRGWLADELTMTSSIVRALKAAGFAIGDGAVQRHRRGECRCGG